MGGLTPINSGKKAFAEWKDGTGTDSLAGFVANATKDFATISMLAQYTTTDEVNGLISNAKAGIISEARQGMATISMLASYTTTTDVNNLIVRQLRALSRKHKRAWQPFR